MTPPDTPYRPFNCPLEAATHQQIQSYRINPQTKARAVFSGIGVTGVASTETYFYRNDLFTKGLGEYYIPCVETGG